MPSIDTPPGLLKERSNGFYLALRYSADSVGATSRLQFLVGASTWATLSTVTVPANRTVFHNSLNILASDTTYSWRVTLDGTPLATGTVHTLPVLIAGQKFPPENSPDPKPRGRRSYVDALLGVPAAEDNMDRDYMHRLRISTDLDELGRDELYCPVEVERLDPMPS